MGCWEESRIERAALRLVHADERGEEAPADLGPFREHARRCARCGRILRRLMETERRFRALRSLRASAENPPRAAVIALVDVERPEAPPVDPAEKPGLECFSYAADARAAPARPEGPRIRHLRSEDGAIEVRVIENEDGRGATAVLVSAPKSADPGGAGRWSLRTGAGSFPFRSGGAAALPAFPEEATIDLLFRPGPEAFA